MSPSAPFVVHLDVFEGPFDLLLQLISRRDLDVTLVALSKVTDEFIAHIRALGPSWDLDQVSDFLVVAATLLDLKTARLLPSAQSEDEEDLARLEARDLLFARLLQYRAFKEVAGLFGSWMVEEQQRFPRCVELEEPFASLLPEVLLGLDSVEFAALAARALQPRPAPEVAVDHLHAPSVSVREQAGLLAERLRYGGAATFRALREDACSLAEVVARFLAVLELYREGLVSFEQLSPLGELYVRWCAPSDASLSGEDEYDDFQAGQR
ncbi:MAG: segregation and condensation protein A [Mycobacteriales bacterium]